MRNIRFIAIALSMAVTSLPGCTGQHHTPACPTSEEQTRPFDAAEDARSFASPAKINCPETWFHFIDGNVTEDGITKDLEAIAGAGISGIQLFHGGQFGGDWPGIKDHITCLSPNWEDAIVHTAKEAKRLGLRFSMQNCPGWAMSGGPWIEPENAMRMIVAKRTDTEGGRHISMALPCSADDATDEEKRWKDYRDIAVLAFPTPEGDTGTPAVPAKITSDISSDLWPEMLGGHHCDTPIVLPPAEEGKPHTIKISYDTPKTLRSIVFSSVQGFSHGWCYEPGIHVTLEAVTKEGTKRVLDAGMPMSAWQDYEPITFALDESTASEYLLSISNLHEMELYELTFLSAARKNSWESEAAHTLRSIPFESENPVQSESAFIRSADILDLSAGLSPDGTLEWDAPEGRWTILRVGHVNNGRKNGPAPLEATGWECDKLSEEGADIHFAAYIGRLNSSALKGSLDAMLMDSWECYTQTWTKKMEEEFESYNGYALRQWIPALLGYVIDSHETSFRFLSDWRDCINYLFSHKFYGRMAEHAKSAGLDITYETAAGDVFPGDILEYFKFTDVPMCEFWNDSRPDHYVGSINFKPIKVTASAAHVYGKTRVSAESFTSFELTWDEHFSRLKDVANQNYSKGVTHSVFHTYTHNPCADTLFPGTSFGSGIGTPFLRGQTWWKYMPEFSTYLARLSYMLERGLPKADVLWYLGDGTMHKPNENYPFPAGYRYDYCNRDVLLNRLTVKDGHIFTPEGIEYSVLWLQDNHHLLPATAAKLRELVEAGMTLIGDAPENIGTLVTGPDVRGAAGHTPDTFAEDIRTLWGASAGKGIKNVGAGRVLSGMSIGEALQVLEIPRDLTPAETPCTETAAGWLHRSAEGADWYFITSPLNEPFHGTLDFRCTGHVTLWDPVTGTVTPIPSIQRNGRSLITLDLPYAGSCFVVFDHCAEAENIAAGEKNTLMSQLDDGWNISFPVGWGAPETLDLTEIAPWNELPTGDEGQAFSGTATYTRTLTVDAISQGERYSLDLGSVEEIAVVYVNGVKVRTLWCPPYSADITEYLREGDNNLKIEVTDTWFNRLVYDASLPEAERKTWVISGPSAAEPLRPSGLIGPVSLIKK